MTDTKKKTVKAGDVVGVDKEKGIIYVVHPVSPEQKKELLREGKILDAKFYKS